jgi:D-alanyl-D-alanine-carboxypeptidase/D-alanyl-D-alanine-endopeptidase
MPKVISIIGIVLCFMAAAMFPLTSACSAAPTDMSAMEAKIQTLAQTYLATRPNSALSIGITYDGKSQYYNVGSVAGKTRQPANSASVYEIGSITKTFTGLLLAQAIAEHRVKPSDDVRKYLVGSYPNLEYGGEPIRLLHLANMTSGLPDNLPDLSSLKSSDGQEADAWAKVKALSAYTREDFFKDLHNVKLTGKPGNDPAHSNTAGQLLGYVLEKIYGASFEALVARYIEKPLAMGADTSSAKIALGHDDHGSVMPALTMESAKASGGLRYSAADMLRYLQYQIGETSQAVVISHQPNWYTLDNKLALGYFWIIEAPKSHDRRFRYSGGTYGCSSFCDFYPARKLGVVLLSNQADRKAQDDLQKLSEAIAAAIHR